MNFNRIEPARDKRKPGENEIEKKQYEFRSFFFFIIIYLFVWLVGFFFNLLKVPEFNYFIYMYLFEINESRLEAEIG